MKNKLLIFIGICILVTFYSCSKTKYKGFKQYTTNFISYYNTYFNIKQRYKIGYREAVYNKQENANDIISVFEFENDPQYFEGIAQFKETAPKVSKLLALRPNNKWMDDALLIEGKIRYLKGDLDSSIQLLSFLVDYYPKGYVAGHLPGGKLKGYDEKLRDAIRKKEPIKQSKFRYKFARNEGIIWLVKAYIKKEQFERAKSLIFQTEGDMGFPLEYRKDLKKTQVMLSIAVKDYDKAIKLLLEILEDKKLSRREQGRLSFILAQIYEKENNPTTAKLYFEKALEGKLSDDLEFEAKLKALTFSQTSPDESLSQLNKMLRKGKYLQNMDKIYFSIGNIYSEKKELDKAITAYQKAISLSKNPNQKFIIYEKAGSIFYTNSNYVMAAKYYDSAQQVIPANYPKKKEFAKKVAALSKLLEHYNKYIEKDSILELAALGPEKAKEKIEKSIKKDYEKEKAKEAYLESQILNSESVKNNSLNAKTNNWYFSNKEAMDKGRINFQKKWGKISLQDNWRKSNANSDGLNSTNKPGLDNSSQNESLAMDLVAEVEASKLPYSASAKKPYIEEIQSSLIQMARIYHYEIVDIQKAIETYELLFKKYPKDIPNEDEVLYSLYRLYLEKEQLAEAEDIKNKLITLYPKSKYSLYAANPNAKSDDEKSDLIVAKRYKEAYKEYRLANYTQALSLCDNIINDYPKHTLIPKVKLLKAFIYSYTLQSRLYINTLEDIESSHPNTLEASSAKEYLDIIKKMKTDNPQNQESNPIKDIPAAPNENLIDKKSTPLMVDKVPEQNNIPQVDKIDAPKIEPPKIVIDSPTNTPKKNTNTTNITVPSENSIATEDGLEIVNYIYNSMSPHYVIYKLTGALTLNSAKNLTDVLIKTKWSSYKIKTEIMELGSDKFIAIGKFKNLETVNSFDEKNKEEIMLQTLNQNAEKYYISSENLDLLYISSGWKQYLSFFQKNYK